VVPFVIAMAILSPFRSAIADWNDVPTGSMEPTIMPGERIFVNKLAYGLRVPFTGIWMADWSKPEAGEIVILFSPKDGTRLVKRVVAGPGDTLELRNNRLYINGSGAAYRALSSAELAEIEASRPLGWKGFEFASEQLNGHSHAVMATPSRPAIRSVGPIVIPDGQYFVMGDNRDNSADSRYFGFVSREKIVGRSPAVVASLDPDRWYKPRWGRFFKGLD